MDDWLEVKLSIRNFLSCQQPISIPLQV